MSYSKNRSSGEQFRREQIVLMQFKSHQTSHIATGCDISTLATLEKSIIILNWNHQSHQLRDKSWGFSLKGFNHTQMSPHFGRVTLPVGLVLLDKRVAGDEVAWNGSTFHPSTASAPSSTCLARKTHAD